VSLQLTLSQSENQIIVGSHGDLGRCGFAAGRSA
jgi:hypothetical protein